MIDQQDGYRLQFLNIDGLKQVHPFDAALVPLIMLPVLVCLGLLVWRLNR
jgi:hypothetical protein